MHYILLLIICCSFEPAISLSSPWLPEKGQYKASSSVYIMDKETRKASKEELEKVSNKASREIAELNKLKSIINDSLFLTVEAKRHRNIMIDEEIENLKTLKTYIQRYYPKHKFAQTLEYGVNEKYSLGFKVISTDEVNVSNKHRMYNWGQIFQKIKIYQNKKYMISVQPSMTFFRYPGGMDDFGAEMRFLVGRVKKHKCGESFNNVEFAQGVAGGSLTFDLNYTAGIKTTRGNILMIQTFNHFEPKADRLYRKTTLEQFSVAKPFIIDNYGAHKTITLQAGYFHEISLSAKKLINSGFLISLWLEM